MDVCQDYEELFATLNAFRIKYLVVGGQAVMFYARPRYTKDIDVWIPSDLNQPEKVFDALEAFGAPLSDMTPQDFTDQKMVFQIGIAPVRIDILVGVPGVSSVQAWKNRKKTLYGKTPIHVLGLNELIQSKRAAGRPTDQLDIVELNAVKRGKK